MSNPRKQFPIFSGVIAYFPDAIKEVAKVSWQGNEQHNKGEPLHWAREKSTDQLDALMRHLTDYASGEIYDLDDQYHLGKVIWRAMAQLQLDIENEQKGKSKGK